MKRIALFMLVLLLAGCVDSTPTPTRALPTAPVVDPSPTQPPSPTLERDYTPTPYWTIPAPPATRTPLSHQTPQVQATPTVVAFMQGKATWYGPGYVGRAMKNGDTYTGTDMTCAVSAWLWEMLAGRTLGVCLLDNSACVEVVVTDCGNAVEFAKYGVRVDLSMAAFQALGLDLAQGVADVIVWIAEEE